MLRDIRRVLYLVGVNWKLVLVVVLPIVLLPLLYIDDGTNSTKFKCAYVLILGSGIAMVEAIPIPITFLLPVALFPLLGILDSASVTRNYMKESAMMTVGGIILALAIEYSNLHKRISFRIMLLFGSSPIRLLSGVMFTTMLLAMWLSNTAITSMMVPICLAVHEKLFQKKIVEGPGIGNSIEMSAFELGEEIPAKTRKVSEVHVEQIIESSEEKSLDAKRMLLLSVAYSVNIGGRGSLLGSRYTYILLEILRPIGTFDNAELNFVSWMMFNVPVMLLNMLFAWFYLVVVFYGFPDWCKFWKRKKIRRASTVQELKDREENVTRMLQKSFAELGPMTFHEKAVASLFGFAIVLWFFREPKFIKGWNDLIPSARIGDATAAILITLLLFLIPKEGRSFFQGKSREGLINWQYIQKRFPWGVLFIAGGGYAFSEAVEKSGLSLWLGEKLAVLDDLPVSVILLISLSITVFATEFISGRTCSVIFLPILLNLSWRLELHPLYLTLPINVACSYGFMLPAATAANSVVFSLAAGDLRIIDMIKTGAFLNISCILVLYLMTISWGQIVFSYDNYSNNATIQL